MEGAWAGVKRLGFHGDDERKGNVEGDNRGLGKVSRGNLQMEERKKQTQENIVTLLSWCEEDSFVVCCNSNQGFILFCIF